MGIGTARGTGQRPIICQSSAAGRCAGRGCALIRQLANKDGQKFYYAWSYFIINSPGSVSERFCSITPSQEVQPNISVASACCRTLRRHVLINTSAADCLILLKCGTWLHYGPPKPQNGQNPLTGESKMADGAEIRNS